MDQARVHQTKPDLINTEINAFDVNSDNLAQIINPILERDISNLEKEIKLSELGFNSIQLVELQYRIAKLTHSNISLEYLLMDPSLKEIEDSNEDHE